MFDNSKIVYHQGKQYIPNITKAKVPGVFRGRPVISMQAVDQLALQNICPCNAISCQPITIDLGKCSFCGLCAREFPHKIQFTTDYKLAVNNREKLIISEGDESALSVTRNLRRPELRRLFSRSLKLRQVSAGGDNSCELELNAANNVQFDMSRFGIEFVASPRHADGIVITGPISKNMAYALQQCYDAVPDPKIVILVGTDAISGGLFHSSPAVDRSFLDKTPIDLFIPGNPTHPLTFINGILSLIQY